MGVKIKLRDQIFEVKSGMTIRAAMKKIDVSVEAVLPTKDGELLTDDEILKAGDVIKLIAVISGG